MKRRFASIATAGWLSCAQPGLARASGTDDWLGRDKASHFSISLALAVGGYEGGASLFPATTPRLAAGAAVALSAGAAKEWSDSRSGGNASWRDFSWDVIGTATGLAVSWLIDRYGLTPRTRYGSPATQKPTVGLMERQAPGL